MPKLPDTHITFRNEETDERKPFVLKTSVSTEGVFRVQLPEEWREAAQHFSREGRRITYGKGAALQAEGAQLSEAINLAKEVMEATYRCETSESLHLVYRFATSLSYWVNPDGSIYPNGGWPGAKGYEAGGKWRILKGNRHRTSDSSEDTGVEKVPTFGFTALVMLRTVHTRAGFETVTWARYRGKSQHDNDETDIKSVLNSWAKASSPPHPDAEGSSYTVIPYSDKACEFFLKVIKSLCRIDLQLCQFFEDAQQVHHAIETGSMNLLAPPNAKNKET